MGCCGSILKRRKQDSNNNDSNSISTTTTTTTSSSSTSEDKLKAIKRGKGSKGTSIKMKKLRSDIVNINVTQTTGHNDASSNVSSPACSYAGAQASGSPISVERCQHDEKISNKMIESSIKQQIPPTQLKVLSTNNNFQQPIEKLRSSIASDYYSVQSNVVPSNTQVSSVALDQQQSGALDHSSSDSSSRYSTAVHNGSSRPSVTSSSSSLSDNRSKFSTMTLPGSTIASYSDNGSLYVGGSFSGYSMFPSYQSPRSQHSDLGSVGLGSRKSSTSSTSGSSISDGSKSIAGGSLFSSFIPTFSHRRPQQQSSNIKSQLTSITTNDGSNIDNSKYSSSSIVNGETENSILSTPPREGSSTHPVPVTPSLVFEKFMEQQQKQQKQQKNVQN